MLRLSLAASVAVFALASASFAQSIQPMGQTHPNALPLNQVAAIAVASLDRAALDAEDVRRHANGQPARYAVPFAADVDVATGGTWQQLDAAWSLWRLRIQAPNASHVNLGMSHLKLPATARLMVYSSDYTNVVRPFDAGDVSPEGELWTPVVGGEEIVLELYVQTAQRPQLQLHLDQIGSGYRFFGAGPTALGTDASGSCNVDVACPSGAAWIAEIPAIAAISTGGSIFCSGFMVNNTAQDGRNYFMTANHCGINSGNAATLVCYWNYQRAVCGSGSGPLTQFNTGATFRANYSTSDFTLVELNSAPNPAWGVTYAGWDHSGNNATTACGIHHPSADVKKISFSTITTATSSYGGTTSPGDSSHVRIISWTSGTTEGGSSGSPLFDQNHHIIGQLHGGGAACGNTLSDYYGRFSMSWTGGGSNTTRLSNWLDPLGTGQLSLDTRGSNSASATAFGAGCYTSYASFYELFAANAFDLSGTASTTVAVQLVPSGGGYQVSSGANAWYTPTSTNLALGDDALSSTRSLPFTFSFPGGATSGIKMCSNGFVWLNGTSTDTDYTPTAAELVANPARIAALWTDLNPGTTGQTYFDIDPTNTAVYCTWNNVPAYNSGTTGNTFQVVLRSNGSIELRYRSVTNLPAGALVGWSRGNGAIEPPARDISATLPFAVGTDAAGLTLAATGRPVQGTPMTLTVDNAPVGTIFAGLLFGLTGYPSGLSLAGIGMPGCSQYNSQELPAMLLVVNGTSAATPFTAPSGAGWAGTHLFVQGAALVSGANQLGVLSSNGLDLKINPN